MKSRGRQATYNTDFGTSQPTAQTEQPKPVELKVENNDWKAVKKSISIPRYIDEWLALHTAQLTEQGNKRVTPSSFITELLEREFERSNWRK